MDRRNRLSSEKGHGDTKAGSSEVRGCLYENVLDMRKRSLIRSESQDSGFSFESSYDPVSSFDAEKFLERLGFAGAKEPLIPDRFIPSLIHRISTMPDNMMKKLDNRVWKSIDSFKKKEHTLWFFTNSSVECDLCVNNSQNAFSKESGDTWHPGNDFYFLRSNSNVDRVNSWLSRFSGGSLTLKGTSAMSAKANIGHISNQSSAESGILSIEEDDEVLTESTNLEGDDFSDLCSPGDRVDAFEMPAEEMESSESVEADGNVTNTGEEVTARFEVNEEEMFDHIESNLTTHPLKKMPAEGKLDLTLPNLDSVHSDRLSSDVFLEPEEDVDRIRLLDSLSNSHFGSDLTFPSKKKRHSFDAAYATSAAAEKRKRFRLSHTRSHNFLFEREKDNYQSDDRVKAVLTNEPTPWNSPMLREIKEESQRKLSVGCRGPEQVSVSQDISGQSESSEGDSFEALHMKSRIDHFEACKIPSRSDSSCDEVFLENDKGSSEDLSETTKHTELDPKVVVPDSFAFALYSSAKQGVASAKMAQHTFSKEACSLQNYYGNMGRIFLTTGSENFVLNKILGHSLKFSILDPMGRNSKPFALENGREVKSFSVVKTCSDHSLKSKVPVLNVQSLTDITTRTSPLNLDAKSIDSTASDKAVAEDNRQRISKPFVRNPSLLSHMSAPKCQAQLINYDGWALFWPSRNVRGSDISPSLGLSSSPHPDFVSTSNRRYTSGMRMAVNYGDDIENAGNEVYLSEVHLDVNFEETEEDPQNKRSEKNTVEGNLLSAKYSTQGVQNECPELNILSDTKVQTNVENPRGRGLKDLEDLRSAIKKAKETRMSASNELKLLQELLQGSDIEEDETLGKRTSTTVRESVSSSPTIGDVIGNRGNGRTVKALSELQQKSENDTSQSKEFWEDEIQKAKEEVCHEKLNAMEQKLHTTEGELSRALEENDRLKDQLELRSAALPVCKCNAVAHNSDFTHMNGISDEDPKITSFCVKPSIPTKNFWQEWDRLQSDLMKAESKADELNILLNQKLIELNKMQLTLSKQTKEMILLEKAYFQLRSHLSKRRLNRSSLSQLSLSLARSSSTTERASEDSSKSSDPEIPP